MELCLSLNHLLDQFWTFGLNEKEPKCLEPIFEPKICGTSKACLRRQGAIRINIDCWADDENDFMF